MKYGISVYYRFLSCFHSLPISALLKTPRAAIFCEHNGISPDLMTIAAIDSINRHRELRTDGPLCDLQWSDPLYQWNCSKSRLKNAVAREAGASW